MKFIQNYLVESNALLEDYHSKIATDCGKLGFRIIGTKTKFSKIDFVNYLASKPITEDVLINNVVISKDHAEKIAKSKQFESEILLNFMNMFKKIAYKWSSNWSDVCLSKQDLESEAMCAGMYAIYGYTNGETSLSTYIYQCALNKVKNVCKKTNQFSDLGSRAIKIRAKFEEAKNTLGPYYTYDEIIKNLNFDEKEILILQSTFNKIASIDSSEEKSNDYSCLGKKFSGVDGSIKFSCSSNGNSFTIRENDSSDNDVEININLNEFSELEKVVLEGFMNSPNNLGISHFAKKLINPKTKKPYSRMAITYAWRRVKEKIKKYSNAA